MVSQSLLVMIQRAKTVFVLLALAAIIIPVSLVFLDWPQLWKEVVSWYLIVTDEEQVKAFLGAWGPYGAPLFFVGVQIFQVVLAPIPGEASGFAGGYLFGTLPGFAYSTIGLTAGSVINFLLGRLLGRRYVEKWVPAHYLSRLDSLAKRQGAVLFFILFVFPGFPKDYLCIFLGLSSLSVKVFLLMCGIGRMPGTLMLSLHGAQIFQKDYTTLALLIAVTFIFVVPACVWRERIYSWVDSLNRVDNSTK